MPILTEWTDWKLRGTVKEQRCKSCDRTAVMQYMSTYRRTDGTIADVYRCMGGDCPAKLKYEVENPEMQFQRPMFSYPRKETKRIEGGGW